MLAETRWPDLENNLPESVSIITYKDVLFDPVRLRIYGRAIQERLDAHNSAERLRLCARCLRPFRRKHLAAGDDVPDLLTHAMRWVGDPIPTGHLAILGEYGQGKSIFAATLALRLLADVKARKRVPILIELGGKSPRTSTTLEMLAAWSARYGIDPQLARAWIEYGQAVIIFDGFDERPSCRRPDFRWAKFFGFGNLRLSPRPK